MIQSKVPLSFDHSSRRASHQLERRGRVAGVKPQVSCSSVASDGDAACSAAASVKKCSVVTAKSSAALVRA